MGRDGGSGWKRWKGKSVMVRREKRIWRENQIQSEEEDEQSDGNENLHDPYDLWSPRTRAQVERAMAREIDDDKSPEHWETDPFLREHTIEQSRRAEAEMTEMRWNARESAD